MFSGRAVIDVHGHISTPPQFRGFAFNLIALRNPASRLTLSDQDMKPGLERHLKMLDRQGIDFQLISPRPVGMMQWEDQCLVDTWTEITNDVIAQQCAMYPQRFGGVAQLPQTRGGVIRKCVDELERCVKTLGFVGALLNPDPAGDRQSPGLNADYWFPLYEAAERLDATLVVHPSITRDPRLSGIPNAYQYNSLTEETLATLLLEHSDVFSRFPKLRIVVCHCGGAPRRLLERGAIFDATNPSRGVDNTVGNSGETAGGQVGIKMTKKEKKRADLTQNLYFDTCAYDPHFLTCALKQRGPERMIFGTEVPGSGSDLLNPKTGKQSDDVLAIIAGFDFLSTEDKIRIVHDNPKKVFPLLSGKINFDHLQAAQ